MKMPLHLSLLLTHIFAGSAIAEVYETPPSKTTSTLDAPYISDEDMEQCVKLYNEAKWLADEMRSTAVDRYSQASVDAYNNTVTRHSNMIDAFNRDCAGKQSESAYKAASRLNNRKHSK